nr:MAG TPA: mobile mystery protein A [Caudoviricetes sp.]
MDKRVKEIRKSLGLSMESFGKRIGITRSERITKIVNALDNGDEFILDVFTTLSKLSPDEWEFLKQIIVKLK